MRRKYGLQRRNRPPTLGRVFIITLIVFFFTVFVSLEIIDKQIRPTLMAIAEQRVEQVARMAISEAISKKMTEDLQASKINNFEMDENGQIKAFVWDYSVVSMVQRNAQRRVENYLKRVERGEPIPEASLDVAPDNDELEIDPENLEESSAFTSVPLGQATNNTLLANLGPKIPIRFMLIGVAESNIRTETKRLGIDNVYLELWMDITVTTQIVVPFETKTRSYTQNIPLDSALIKGEVPEFYGEGGSTNTGPDISIPYDSLN